MWECQKLKSFWKNVSHKAKYILGYVKANKCKTMYQEFINDWHLMCYKSTMLLIA